MAGHALAGDGAGGKNMRMSRSTLGYHTRLVGNTTVKVHGGSFSGEFDRETVDRLVNTYFSVIVKPSGTPVFVDAQGREVYVYISVDPALTPRGAAALKAWRAMVARQWEEDKQRQEEQREELEAAMAGLTHEEAIRRLRATGGGEEQGVPY